MPNKSIAIFLAVIVAVVAGVVFYNYSIAPISVDSSSSDSNENIEPDLEISKTEASILVDPNSFDLGTVIYGEVAEKVFSIRNIGDDPVEILRVSTSCGCTKASVDEGDMVIQPGQSSEMFVTFDPAVHKENPDLGDLTRIVYIKTDDPIKPEIEVELKASVIKK